MGQRTYNILFHTHTVSGIVISVLLYVIFFAGSFSFFRDEIANWERGETVAVKDELSLNFDKVLDSLEKTYPLYSRDIEIRHFFNERKANISLGASKDSLLSADKKAGNYIYLDTKTHSSTDYMGAYSLGEFLYRLHFFAQVPYPFGYYLSGFTAFFFLFAIVTGIIVHWKKIVSNFYLFRPLAKLKVMWTDAHTALGVIGFPFQFVYAVTGAFFMLKLLLVAPSVFTLYNGDESKLYDDLEYNHPVYNFTDSKLTSTVSINAYAEKAKALWPTFKLQEIHIFNYGDENMHISVSGQIPYKSSFNGLGNIIYQPSNGSLEIIKDPTQSSSYLDGVKNVLYRIHYGDYAGYGLKILSFILGLISCFVIISGVMIWLVARDKKHIPEKRRRFNEAVVRYYLAICLSMFPATALTFILVKLYQPAGMTLTYYFYFLSWLAFSVFFIIRKNNALTNMYTLFLGAALGILVPIANGLMSGKWIWIAYKERATDIWFIDVFWIALSLVSFTVAIKLMRKRMTRL